MLDAVITAPDFLAGLFVIIIGSPLIEGEGHADEVTKGRVIGYKKEIDAIEEIEKFEDRRKTYRRYHRFLRLPRTPHKKNLPSRIPHKKNPVNPV